MLLITLGFYPVAIVDGSIVSARKFSKHYQADSLYYSHFLETYKALVTKDAQVAPAELQASVLEQLIEDALVHKAIRKELGDDFQYLLDSKVNKFSNDQQLQRATLTLYGLDVGDFKDEILVPQAEREMLSAKLFLKGKKLDDWLLQAKRDANVRVLSSQFHWVGDKVEVKG